MVKYYMHKIVSSFRCPHCHQSTEELFSEEWAVDMEQRPTLYICPHCKERHTFDEMWHTAWVMTPMTSEDYVTSIENIRVGVTSDNSVNEFINRRREREGRELLPITK